MTTRTYLLACMASLVGMLGLTALVHHERVSPQQAAQMRISDRLEQVEADQEAINSASVTGQNVQALVAACRIDTTAYNTAVTNDHQYLPAGYPAQLTSKDCTP